MDSRHVKTHLETPFLPTSLDKHEGLEMCQNASWDPLPSSLPLASTRPKTHLRPCFLFSFFFFLFSFFYHFILLTTIYRSLFQILKLQHPDDMSGTRKGSRHISSPVCLFFFLQSNFFLLKIIYIEITYGHKHEWLHHPHYEDEGLNNTLRCIVWAKSRFFFNSLGFLHTN